MKTVFATAVALPLLLAGVAYAGELTRQSPVDFYIGAHADLDAAQLPVGYSDGTRWDGLGFFGPGAGVFLGANLVSTDKAVVGIEGDLTRLGLSNVDYDGTRNATLDWMGTVDARFGVQADPGTLIYGKIGGGVVTVDIPDTAYVAPGTGSRMVGVVQVGAGIDTAIAPHWKARLEGDYTQAVDAYSVTADGLGYDLAPRVLSARAGLIYSFDGSAPSRPATPADEADWNGPYLGVLAGGAVSDTVENYGTGPVSGTSWDGFGGANANAGIFAGLNQQIGQAVLGAEISGTWLGLKNTDTYGGFDWGDLDWMAALDGRAGLLVSPQTLVYAKGGFALIDFRSDYPNYPTGPQSHELLNGFQVGGGIETRVSDRLSVRVEGVYTAALKGLEFDSSPPTQDHFFTPHVVSADIGAAIHF